jgi:hypothetical protein
VMEAGCRRRKGRTICWRPYREFRSFLWPWHIVAWMVSLGTGGETPPMMKMLTLPVNHRYLLGSGGTLVFDLTIMCQAMHYGSAKPLEPPIHHDSHHRTHDHHRSRSRGTDGTS